MNGPRDSVIGVEKDSVMSRFLTGEKSRFNYAETGECDINALFVEIGEGRKAAKIELFQDTIDVS
jgi:calcineurin-like phosphoesterase